MTLCWRSCRELRQLCRSARGLHVAHTGYGSLFAHAAAVYGRYAPRKRKYKLIFGAILLFFVNIVCINLASIITFRLQGIGPRSWWEANKAGKAVKVTIISWLVVLGLLALSLFLSKAL